MYLQHFGFTTAPFAINPDPRFLYLSPQHQEALAHLLYGLGEGGGFVMLSGEVGAGKTTLCYSLLEHLGAEVDVAFIMNPRLGAVELLAALCDELHVAYPAATESRKVLIDSLNRFLLENHARGRRTVAVIDEAQHLSLDVLEQVRLLTNLETPTTKLLQIILVGQPELSELLARREVRQVDQRITARYHLGPLNEREARHYIRHRLQVAGGPAEVFSAAALREIFRFTRGVPRLINILCDRSLLGAYTLDRTRVDAAIVGKAAREVGRAERRAPMPAWQWVAAAFFVVATFGALLGFPGGARVEQAVSGAVTGNAPSVPEASATRAHDPDPGTLPVASKTTAAPDSPSRPLLTAWLNDAFFQEGNALAQIVKRWRPQVPVQASSCAGLAALGLSCLRLRPGWDRLLRQDLPAVLRVRLRDGRERAVALVGGDDRRALLVGADGAVEAFALSELLPLWTGEALVVWEMLADRVTYLAPGMSHASLPMLRRQLDAAGFPALPEGPPERFDARLTDAVISYQRAVGISADGIVGPETLAGLMAAVPRPGVPSLHVHSMPD